MLLSHSTLDAAFHQNFTPILTITQLVNVRSNHSESGNHDQLLLIKLLESVAGRLCFHESLSKVWVNRQNQLWKPFRWFPSLSSRLPNGDCVRRDGVQKSVGKLVKSAKTHPAHFLFTKSIVTICSNYPQLFGAKSNEQPWEPFANCDVSQHYGKDRKPMHLIQSYFKSILKV